MDGKIRSVAHPTTTNKLKETIRKLTDDNLLRCCLAMGADSKQDEAGRYVRAELLNEFERRFGDAVDQLMDRMGL